VCEREREREREREYLAHRAKNHRETQRKRQTDRHTYTHFAASRVQIPRVLSDEDHEQQLGSALVSHLIAVKNVQ
jgi:hypothetical protein